MAETTSIEWCDSTWNPWIGCTRVSPACDDCYAARSTPARTLGVAWGPGKPRRRTSAANWRLPAQWNARDFYACADCGSRNEGHRDGIGAWVCNACGSVRLSRVRRRVFCASLADVFDNEVPDDWRVDLFHLIERTPDLDWLLLTKRVGNVLAMMRDVAARLFWMDRLVTGELPPNVWLGITVVNQAEVDRDVPRLLRVPARVRFLSIEPMLSPIDLDTAARKPCRNAAANGINMDPETGAFECCRRCDFTGLSDEWDIDWVICGGESGPRARPIHPDWARSLRDQCAEAGVPFLFKQWGEWAADQASPMAHVAPKAWNAKVWPDMTVQWRAGKKAAGRLLDGRTHDAWPEVRHA